MSEYSNIDDIVEDAQEPMGFSGMLFRKNLVGMGQYWADFSFGRRGLFRTGIERNKPE